MEESVRRRMGAVDVFLYFFLLQQTNFSLHFAELLLCLGILWKNCKVVFLTNTLLTQFSCIQKIAFIEIWKKKPGFQGKYVIFFVLSFILFVFLKFWSSYKEIQTNKRLSKRLTTLAHEKNCFFEFSESDYSVLIGINYSSWSHKHQV